MHAIQMSPTLRDDWQDGPRNRWTFQHISNLFPTAQIARDGAIAELPAKELDLSGVGFCENKSDVTFDEMLERTFTDAIVILHDGTIVFERYLNGMTPETKHVLMSVSKSVTAVIAAALAANGLIDLSAHAGSYATELAGSAFGDASVQQLLDMQVSVAYSEAYDDPASEAQTMRRAAGWRTRRENDPDGIYRMLTGLVPTGPPGQVFQYCSATTDALAWVIERAADASFAETLSRTLWARLGAEHDAVVSVDRQNAPVAHGGICSTTRDLARVGQMVLQDGRWHGEQIVPPGWIDDIRQNGDVDAWRRSGTPETLWFPNGWYRNKWWVTGDGHGSFHGAGIYGQHLWIDPAAEVVIAKFSSWPTALDADLTMLTHEGFHAVIDALMETR